MVTPCVTLAGHLTDANNSNLISQRTVKGGTYKTLFDLKSKTVEEFL
jgi:hypothetical protein